MAARVVRGETPQPDRPGGIFSSAEYEARERTVQARARTAEAQARSAEARAGRDTEPQSSGPRGHRAPPGPVRRGATKARTRATSTGRRSIRVLRRTAPRRALFTEFVAMCIIIGVAEVARSGGVPSPGVLLPPVVVFLVLGMVADFSPGSARLAVAFGGLVLLTTALMHSQGIIDGLRAVQGAGAPSYAIGGGQRAQAR